MAKAIGETNCETHGETMKHQTKVLYEIVIFRVVALLFLLRK